MQRSFESFVQKSEGCWLWLGCRDKDGYGIFRRGLKAHRVAHELWIGPIPKGHFVIHSCDNPPCVSPFHIRAATPAENTQDMVLKGRSRFRGADSLSLERVALIRSRVAAGEVQRAVARELGVHFTTVNRIVRGRTWKGVSYPIG